MKQGESLFSILVQKRAEAVRILQERCAFPSDNDFINALECNSVEGWIFWRRDVNIANDIYGYSKGDAMGRFKNPHKDVMMDRTTADIVATTGNHEKIQGNTLGYRFIVCEQETVSSGNIMGHRVYIARK